MNAWHPPHLSHKWERVISLEHSIGIELFRFTIFIGNEYRNCQIKPRIRIRMVIESVFADFEFGAKCTNQVRALIEGRSYMQGSKALFITRCAIMTALLCTAHYICGIIPHFEITTLLFIIWTFVYGKEMFFVSEVFALIQIMMYGVHYWTVFHLYIWAILVAASLVLKNALQNSSFRKTVGAAILAGVFGAFYGTLTVLCAVPFGFATALSWWISGLYWDMIHGAVNFVSALILFERLYQVNLYCRRVMIEGS